MERWSDPSEKIKKELLPRPPSHKLNRTVFSKALFRTRLLFNFVLKHLFGLDINELKASLYLSMRLTV